MTVDRRVALAGAAMSRFELDHVFFATEAIEDAVGFLQDSGLVFDRSGNHPGQGTANSCAILENGFVEILVPTSRDELTSEVVRPLGLDERIRWKETGACPFGFCLRAREDAAPLPFPTWGYAARYLPAGKTIPIVTPAGALHEPMVFLAWHEGSRCSADSPNAGLTISKVGLRLPEPLSPGLRWCVEDGLFEVDPGPRPELGLYLRGDPKHGKDLEATPGIPICVQWRRSDHSEP